MINLDRVCSALVDADFSNEEIVEVRSKLVSEDNYSFFVKIDKNKSSYTAKEIFGVDENDVEILNATMNSIFEKYYDIAEKKAVSENSTEQSIEVLDLIIEVMETYTIKDLEMSTFHYIKACFENFCNNKRKMDLVKSFLDAFRENTGLE